MGRPFKRRKVTRKKRSWRRKLIRGKSGFAKAVKNVILRTAEKKFRSVDLSFSSAFDLLKNGWPLNHNSVVAAPIFDNTFPDNATQPVPSQGIGDSSRNGDEIYGKGITLRGSIDFAFDRTNAITKMYLVEWNTTQGSLTKADLQYPITGNVMLDPFQSDRWKVKYIGTVRPRTGNYHHYDVEGIPVESGKTQTVLFKKFIPFKRKLSFKEDSSNVICKGMKERLSLVFITYDALNTVSSATMAYARVNATFHYGDP